MTRGTPILVFKWIPGTIYPKLYSKPGISQNSVFSRLEGCANCIVACSSIAGTYNYIFRCAVAILVMVNAAFNVAVYTEYISAAFIIDCMAGAILVCVFRHCNLSPFELFGSDLTNLQGLCAG